MFKKMLTLLFAVLFVVPFAATADDFDDDFGGFDEEESEESEESGESEEDEEAPADSKVKEKSESDAAMRDLMGETEEKPAPKKAKTAEKNSEPKEAAEEETAESSAPALKGLKPIMLVKGSFTVFGQYKRWNGENSTKKTSTMSTMFGGVDEGLLGLEYMGKHVIAKGTMNLRTDNAIMKEATHNPLMEENLHSIQNGAANALYEIYGGVKFFDVFIKGGKMIPEYGLIDTYQELGMGFATPFLTRSLIVVEGFVPETDAGLSIGYDSIFAKDHNFFIGLTLGTGSNKSEFWTSDKTMGLYGRIGYGFKEYIKAAVAFQFRQDFSNVAQKTTDEAGVVTETGTKYSKKVDMIGFGVHLKGAVAGFEMPVSFDYNMMKMVSHKDGRLKKNITGMLVSAAPGYAYHFKHEWVDKISIAVRFDLVQGVYISKEANYLDSLNFRGQGMYYRIGATANFFTKELAGVRAMAGLTFLMQPESKVGNNTYKENGRKKDYGFTTIVLQAGAEF